MVQVSDIDRIVNDLEAGNYEPPQFPIVTICGSVRFKEDMLKWSCYFTDIGYIVLMPHCFEHGYFHNQQAGQDKKFLLDVIHFRKIFMSTHVFVVDIDGYIGESTAREIRVAEKLDLKIFYASKIKDLPSIHVYDGLPCPDCGGTRYKDIQKYPQFVECQGCKQSKERVKVIPNYRIRVDVLKSGEFTAEGGDTNG